MGLSVAWYALPAIVPGHMKLVAQNSWLSINIDAITLDYLNNGMQYIDIVEHKQPRIVLSTPNAGELFAPQAGSGKEFLIEQQEVTVKSYRGSCHH